MNKGNALKIQFELLWLLITVIVLAVVLIPVYLTTIGYQYWAYNALFIIVFIQFSRLIFFLKHSFAAKVLWPKVVIFFLCIPLFFLLLEGLGNFQKFLDEAGIQSIMEHLSIEKQNYWGRLVRTQMMFFAAASIVVTLLFPFRMMVSIWRITNTNKV